MEIEGQIIKAAREGNISFLEQLLEQHRDLNYVWHGSTPLLAAVGAGQKEVVLSLLVRGADPNRVGECSTTALVQAIAAHELEIATILLAHNADPNGHVSGYDTPLLRAIACGQSDSVQLLLNYGADPNYGVKRHTLVDPYRVPLIFALKRMLTFSEQYTPDYKAETMAIVRLLLERNANPNIKGNYCESLYGIQLRERKPAIEEKIKAKGQENDFQEVPLSLAAQAGDKSLVQLLLSFGAYTEGGGGLSEIPLHAAIDGLQPTMVTELLNIGAFIDSQDFYGQTAVHKAAYNAISDTLSYECLEILVHAGADVNRQNYEGDTPLMYIFAYYNSFWQKKDVEPIIKLLLSAHALLTIRNVDGFDGHTLAQRQGYNL